MSSENSVKQRALGAIVTNALLRWESLVTIALTAILFLFVKEPFPWWQDWFWLVGGAIAEAALVISAITDPQAATQAVAREFEAKFDLGEVKSGVSRERLQKALEYRRNMLKLTERHQGAMRASLSQTVADINNWIQHMYDLALHIDAFDKNELVERDRRAVPGQIDKVRTRLNLEKDATVRRDLENQLRQLEQQQENLEATVNSVKRAEIQLDSTLSSLGTIYAQMSLLGTKEVDSARAQRLRLEIQDEVSSLQDTIAAMDEVQSQRLSLR
jgi:hypothetical protein